MGVAKTRLDDGRTTRGGAGVLRAVHLRSGGAEGLRHAPKFMVGAGALAPRTAPSVGGPACANGDRRTTPSRRRRRREGAYMAGKRRAGGKRAGEADQGRPDRGLQRPSRQRPRAAAPPPAGRGPLSGCRIEADARSSRQAPRAGSAQPTQESPSDQKGRKEICLGGLMPPVGPDSLHPRRAPSQRHLGLFAVVVEIHPLRD